MNIIFASLYRFYRDGNLMCMPSPVDRSKPSKTWEADRAGAIAAHLATYGTTHYLFGPLTMSQGFTAINADGYGKQFDLNFGQYPNRPTRVGPADNLINAIGQLHAHGIAVMEDAVVHQYDGGYPYYELGPDGRPDRNLFPKTKGCFVPNAKVDNVFDSDGNYADGDMVSYQNSLPSGYMLHGVIRCLQIRKERLGLDGGRFDEAKGEAASVTERMIERVGGYWVCECFTGNPQELAEYIRATGGKNVLDFGFYWAIRGICDYGASLKTIPGAGVVAIDPDHSVLFAGSADMNIQDSENIKFNSLHAIFLTLTRGGSAMIHAQQYLDAEGCYGLGKYIDQMMWVARMFCFGPTEWPWVDDTLLVWSRNGDGGAFGWSGGLLCGLSTESINWRNEWVKVPFDPDSWLHDYLGNYEDVQVNADGYVNLAVGPNADGKAQNCFAYAMRGVNHSIPIVPLPNTQKGSLTDFSDF